MRVSLDPLTTTDNIYWLTNSRICEGRNENTRFKATISRGFYYLLNDYRINGSIITNISFLIVGNLAAFPLQVF